VVERARLGRLDVIAMPAPGEADDASGRHGARLVRRLDGGATTALVSQGLGDLPGIAGHQGQFEGLQFPLCTRVAELVASNRAVAPDARRGPGLDVSVRTGDLLVGEMEDGGSLGDAVVL